MSGFSGLHLYDFNAQFKTTAFIGALLFLIGGCGIEKPESPRWTVDLAVPIASRHIDGPYIASHAGSDYLHWTDESGLSWNIAADLDTVRVGDNLITHPTNTIGAYALSEFVVGRGSELACEIQLEDVAPLAAGVVPELTASVSASFPTATAFDSLSGASGLLRLNVVNELGLSIDGVTVTLSSQLAAPIAEVHIPDAIASGETRAVEHPLVNVSVGDDWTALIDFHTAGGTVLSAADRYLAVSASFPNGMHVEYARGVIDPTSQDFVDSLVISNTHELSSADIAAGGFSLHWTNNTPLDVVVEWAVPDLTMGGVPLSGQIACAAGASSALPIQLAGSRFATMETSSKADLNIRVSTNGSLGETVEINGLQTVDYSIDWAPLVLSSAAGQIAATQISTAELTASLEWDDGLADTGIDSCDAVLVLKSSLPLDGQVSGRLTTNTGLDIPFSGLIATGAEVPAVSRILLAQGLELRPLPSSAQLEGSFTFGGGEETVSVNASDFIATSVELLAPAHMYVDDVSIEVEPTSVELSGDDFGDRTGRLLHATVTIEVTNRFPLGGQFTLRVAADSALINTDAALIFGPSTLDPALTNDNGYAVSPQTTRLTYELDSADLKLFEHEFIWFSESLVLLGPGNGQAARISSSDVLDWHAQARLEMKLDSGVRPWED